MISLGISSSASADIPSQTKAASTATQSKDESPSLEKASEIQNVSSSKSKQTKTVNAKAPQQTQTDSERTNSSISKINPKPDSKYFQFAGPEKFNDFDLAGQRAEYHAWKPVEIKKIKVYLDFVFNKFPGLLKRASAGRPLSLFRSNMLGEAPRTAKGELPKDDYLCLAATSSGAIAFVDSFFDYSELNGKRMTTHELVHAADIGDSIAFSAEWVSFVKRNSIKLDKCDYLYAEALANTFADYAVGKPVPDADRFKQEIVNRLCTDTEQSQTYRTLIGKGLRFNTQKKYSNAIECFESAAKQLPSAPTPYILSTLDFYRLQKRKEALKQSALAQNLIDANGIQIGEQRLQLFFYLRALLLASEVRDYKGAIKLIDRVLVENGDHKKAKELKAFCLEQLNAKP